MNSYRTLLRPEQPLKVKELQGLTRIPASNCRVVIDGLGTDANIVEVGLGYVNDEQVFIIEIESAGTWSES